MQLLSISVYLIDMTGLQRKLFHIAILGVFLLTSCVSGFDPIPSDIKDLSMSWSLPIGKSDFKIKDGNVNGLPIDLLSLLQIDTIVYSDTVSVNLSEINDKASSIRSLAFKINVWNEFPADGNVYLYFADNDGMIIKTSLDAHPINIVKGRVLINGDIVSTGFSPNVLTFNEEDIKKISEAKNLIFNAKLSLKNTNTNTFKYFNSFTLTCQLAARIDFTIN